MWKKHIVIILLILLETSRGTVDNATDETVDATTTATVRSTTTRTPKKKYDYIIVGAGTSGSLLSSRLSESAICGEKILVLEAGKEPLPESQIPAYADRLLHTEMNWGYLWEPQRNFGFGIEDYRLPCPRGKALGGTTSINNMLYIRGNPDDFNSWLPKMKTGWTYEELLHYMKKPENYTVKFQDEKLHGKNGNLTVEDVIYRTEAARAFVKAFGEYGYPYIDYNSDNQIGVSFIHAQTKRGVRETSYAAFLGTRVNFKNLLLIAEARVIKILVSSRNKATGVAYIKNGSQYTAEATKEIIICAGPINTPQLLMLSGIGPKRHLKQLGIHTISDLPVGKKLYEQISFLGLTYTVNESITFAWKDLTSRQALDMLKKKRYGPLTSTAYIEAIAMVDTHSLVNETEAIPNVAFLFMGLALNSDNGTNIKRKYRVTDKMYQDFWGRIQGQPAFMIIPVLLRPKSTGRLKLRCDDPAASPLIRGNFYTDTCGQDIKVMISAIRLAQLLIRMPAFVRYNATLLSPIPGCEHFLYDSDDYWECGLRQLPITLYNPQSTCQMGYGKEGDSVVTPTLKVRGVLNLRVADASVFPRPVGGDITAVSLAVAERIAEIIKGRMADCAKHHRTH